MGLWGVLKKLLVAVAVGLIRSPCNPVNWSTRDVTYSSVVCCLGTKHSEVTRYTGER